VNVQLLEHKYSIEDNTRDIYSFERIFSGLKTKRELMSLQVDNFKFVNNNKNKLNTESNLNIDNILILGNDKKIHFKMNINQINSLNKVIPKSSIVDFKQDFSIENSDLSYKDNKIKLEKFNINFNIENLNKKSLSRVLDDLVKNKFKTNKYKNIEINNIYSLLNNGMNIVFNTGVVNLEAPIIKSATANFNFNIKILENQLDKNTITLDKLLSKIDFFVELKIDEDTAEELKKIDNVFGKYLEMAFKKNGNIVFQLENNNSKISLNGIDSSLVSNSIGNIHYDNKNFNNAIKFYTYAVNNGNKDAYFNLALSYNELKKYKKAIEYYKKAIKNNPDDWRAMHNLARVYTFGKKNYKMGLVWFKLSLDKKSNIGYFGVAYSYDMLEDFENAKKWYKKAIDKQGEVVAMWNLGLIYEYGKGNTSKNNKKALELYLNAAELGYINAIKKVSYMYKYGIGTKKDIKKTKYWKAQQDKAMTYDASINDLVLNITNIRGKEKLMKLSFSMKSTESTIKTIINKNKAEIIDTVISQVSSRSSEELLTVGGKELFREDLLIEINNLINKSTFNNKEIKPDNIKKILFTAFIVK
jgi:flagellar FliL protein